MESNIDINQMDEFDYEKIQQILEEEERNRIIRKENEARLEKEKQREKERKDRDRHKKRDRSRSKSKSISIERKKPRGHQRKRSRSRSRRKDSRGRDFSKSRRSKSREKRRDKEKEKVYVEKTIEEAKRQALEAQRDDCTILVYKLHLLAKEKDLFNFFAQANIGKIIDIKVIRDPRTGKSKGVAYVEFETHESVLLAIALSGQQISGQSIVIQHSQAEKNRQAAAAKYKKEIIKEQHRVNSKKALEISDDPDGPMKIYVGGLTDLLDVTDSDLRAIFSPFGEIEQIDMPKDPMTLKPRGYCFVMYRRASQGHSAIAAMNGFKFKGKTLRVGVTHEYSKQHPHLAEIAQTAAQHTTGEAENEHLHNLQSKQALMQILNRDVRPQEGGVTTYTDSSGSVQTPCLLLSNLFDPAQVNLKEDPNFYSDTKQDVFEECSNFGKVEGVWVDQHSQGNVWVKFANNNWQASKAALAQLNGRWFASRPILAQLVQENVFEEKISNLK